MDYIEVKNILGYKTNKHDAYIDTVIPLLIEYIEDYCNYQFTDELGKPIVRGGAKIAIAKMVEYNLNKAGTQSSSLGGELSYTYTTDFPPSIIRLLEPYMRIRI